MRASLFITCYNDTLYPETGRAVVRLLERLGVEIEFRPQQTCCGQMHANTGFRSEAFSQAARFVRLYQDAESVVIPSSSCVAMIRDQYPGLFAELGDDDLRKQFATLLPRIFELSEFLVDQPWRRRRRRLLPAPRHVPRKLPRAARTARRRQAAPPAQQSSRPRACPARQHRSLLRIRRHLLHQELLKSPPRCLPESSRMSSPRARSTAPPSTTVA